MTSVFLLQPYLNTAYHRTYLRHCIRVSLLKRWSWPLVAASFWAMLAWQATCPLWAVALLALTGLLLSAGWIALSSWQRHATDLSPFALSPFA